MTDLYEIPEFLRRPQPTKGSDTVSTADQTPPAPPPTSAKAPRRTMSSSNLRPCPFCGGEARREDLGDPGNDGGSCIACTKCGASSPVHFNRKENLNSSWNQRCPILPIPDADLRATAAKVFTADPMSPLASAFVEGAKFMERSALGKMAAG